MPEEQDGLCEIWIFFPVTSQLAVFITHFLIARPVQELLVRYSVHHSRKLGDTVIQSKSQ